MSSGSMNGSMSIEDCRKSQIACATRVEDTIADLRREVAKEIAELRRETKSDISAIREAVQTIDRNVSQIKGYLGLNGNTGPQASLHEHRRKGDEEIARLHARLDDVIKGLDRKDKSAPSAPSAPTVTEGITLPRWAVYASAALLLLIVILSAAAGERGLLWLLKLPNESAITQRLPVPGK